MYNAPGKVIATFDKHRVVEERVGIDKHRAFSVWGPDATGADCRISRHLGLATATEKAKMLSGLEAQLDRLMKNQSLE